MSKIVYICFCIVVFFLLEFENYYKCINIKFIKLILIKIIVYIFVWSLICIK